jgi:hypothetical protein
MNSDTAGSGRIQGRAAALVSGVTGIAASVFLVGFFTLEPLGVSLGGLSLGTVNDALGAVQFAALAPVAWILAQHLPPTRTVRAATWVGVVAAAADALLSVLLVARVLTFEAQIGPLMVAIVAVYGWLVVVSLVGQRTRTLPRGVAAAGLLTGLALLVGLVLAVASMVLPQPLASIAQWSAYVIGGLGWLGLPVHMLLLAARVFSRAPSPRSAEPSTALPVQ